MTAPSTKYIAEKSVEVFGRLPTPPACVVPGCCRAAPAMDPAAVPAASMDPLASALAASRSVRTAVARSVGRAAFIELSLSEAFIGGIRRAGAGAHRFAGNSVPKQSGWWL